MQYEDIITTFDINYFKNSLSTVWFKDRFCMVDNLDSKSGSEPTFLHKLQGSTKFRLPVKLTMSLCLFCKEGHISVRMQQKDFELKAGSIFVSFGGQILEKVEISEDSKIIFFAADSKYVAEEVQRPRSRNLRQWVLRSQEPTMLNVSKEEMENYEKLCTSVKYIFQNSDTETAEGMLIGFTYMIGSLLLEWTKDRNAGPINCDSSHENNVLMKFKEDVHNFAHKDRSVAFYAKRQYLSPKHFSRLIKKACGSKPLEIIEEYVILEAKSLLLTGKYSIKQVCEMLGFSNYSFFSRYFKNAIGMSPGEFLRSE
jgi:AraC-like DNA-binding protein